MNDIQLLKSFAEEASETAFRTLVERHLPLVLGTTRRITGEPALAEEIGQALARDGKVCEFVLDFCARV